MSSHKDSSKEKSKITPTATPPMVTCRELSSIWKKLWQLTVGAPNSVTRKQLQQSIGVVYPKETTLGCLRTFSDEGLIKCLKGDEIIKDPFKESDFEVFVLSGKGTKLGETYTC